MMRRIRVGMALRRSDCGQFDRKRFRFRRHSASGGFRLQVLDRRGPDGLIAALRFAAVCPLQIEAKPGYAWERLLNRPDAALRQARADQLVERLDGRPVVLVGMMGAGKTTVGRRLATR